MTIKIYAYKTGSRSARALADILGVRRLRHTGSRWRGGPVDTVINWGASSMPAYPHVLNTPAAVSFVSNKLNFFTTMSAYPGLVPEATTCMDMARDWSRNGDTVVCRTSLTGHSGRGIVLAETEESLARAPLYTKYVPKKHEYRVHVNRAGVFDVQRKARKNDVANPNWQIRTHDTGFIYMRNDVDVPGAVTQVAVETFGHFDLDFGAVDVIYSQRRGAKALEINTAPGLEGTTLENYATMLRGLI